MVHQSRLAARLAALYAAAPTDPTEAERAALRTWICAEFDRLPCHVDFWYQEVDLSVAQRIYRQSNVLAISVLHNNHPFLSFADNAKFRAVHDWHHISGGFDSTLSGEIFSYKMARKSAPRDIWWLLHSEIILQAAACLYHGEFQPQKLIKAF
jgi:hypothetical protein